MITDHHRLRLQDLPYKVGAGDIAIHVRRQIIGGDLLHGERLPPERAFADQFGVSRGTVRDALRRLEEGGFVEKRPGSGTYVTYSEAETVSIAQSTSPLELIDTRYALEPQIVRFAVLNATEQAFLKAESALEVMERSEYDSDSFSLGDEAFHLALAECTRNAMLVWITKRVSEVRKNTEWARMRQLTLSAEMIRRYNVQHREIFEAVRRRDAERGSQGDEDALGPCAAVSRQRRVFLSHRGVPSSPIGGRGLCFRGPLFRGIGQGGRVGRNCPPRPSPSGLGRGVSRTTSDHCR